MLKFRRLPAMGNDRCHECGRQWFETIMNPNDGPDIRPYVELKGVVGCCQIRTVICPHCLDENAETLFDAASYRHLYAGDRDYDRELGIAAVLSRIPFIEEDRIEHVERAVIGHFNLKAVR